MQEEDKQVNDNQSLSLVKPQFLLNTVSIFPILHPNKLAIEAGVTEGVVGGWMDNGYLPTVKVGRYQMINMVQLVENLKNGRVL